jgi:hypothetical protein
LDKSVLEKETDKASILSVSLPCLSLFLIRSCLFSLQCAYRGLRNWDDETRRLIRQAVVAKNREEQKGFFNQAIQKELALRPKSRYHLRDFPEEANRFGKLGGIASGKIWTEAKITAAKANGKNLAASEHPRLNGIRSRQSSLTGEKLAHRIHWVHSTGIKVVTDPQKAVADLVPLLNQGVPNSVKFSSGLSAVLRGIEPRRYGWSIEKYESVE